MSFPLDMYFEFHRNLSCRNKEEILILRIHYVSNIIKGKIYYYAYPFLSFATAF